MAGNGSIWSAGGLAPTARGPRRGLRGATGAIGARQWPEWGHRWPAQDPLAPTDGLPTGRRPLRTWSNLEDGRPGAHRARMWTDRARCWPHRHRTDCTPRCVSPSHEERSTPSSTSHCCIRRIPLSPNPGPALPSRPSAPPMTPPWQCTRQLQTRSPSNRSKTSLKRVDASPRESGEGGVSWAAAATAAPASSRREPVRCAAHDIPATHAAQSVLPHREDWRPARQRAQMTTRSATSSAEDKLWHGPARRDRPGRFEAVTDHAEPASNLEWSGPVALLRRSAGPTRTAVPCCWETPYGPTPLRPGETAVTVRAARQAAVPVRSPGVRIGSPGQRAQRPPILRLRSGCGDEGKRA